MTQGEPNPHVHMLMRWRVDYRVFKAWSARIENLWGMGFAHLEKIKDGNAAAAYMMKAAGYLTKGKENENGEPSQGIVRGNRYGISKEARAPDWVTVSETQLHAMGHLIADVHDFLTMRCNAEYAARRKLNAALDKTPKQHKGKRRAIGKKLANVREILNKLPIVASKYQVILKGKEAYHTFLNWAQSPGYWKAANNEWLPEKGPGQCWRPGARPASQWLDWFKSKHFFARSLRQALMRGVFGWTDHEFSQAVSDYESWAAA